jgi:uncharacterized phiE125 gp8 family phage protein
VISYLDIQVTEPETPTEPVTLADVKAWANIDFNDDDALITSMIIGARQDIENATNLALVAKGITLYAEASGDTDIISLPYGDASTIVVKGVESDETLSAKTVGSDYYLRANRFVVLNTAGNYQVTYTAGTVVPQALKEAIKMLVAYRYNNRGDQDKQQGLPEDIKQKVEKYVQIWL